MKYHRCGVGSCVCHCSDCREDPDLVIKQREGKYYNCINMFLIFKLLLYFGTKDTNREGRWGKMENNRTSSGEVGILSVSF
jgi:hypothetical protein